MLNDYAKEDGHISVKFRRDVPPKHHRKYNQTLQAISHKYLYSATVLCVSKDFFLCRSFPSTVSTNMPFTDHEENVSDFYSRIVDKQHNWNEGFLTFGIWKTPSGDPIPPPQCYQTTYDELLESSKMQADHNVLEVACGQGAGMLRIKSKYGCNIQGLDISVANVEIAKRRLCDTGITITRGSATKMPFDDNFFDCVICVEGGPHFDTREGFFQEAFRVLKPGGRLLVADLVVLKALQHCSYYQQFIMKTGAWLWLVPCVNMSYGIDGYEQMIKHQGFKNTKVEFIGERVIPGYCRFNLTLSVMRQQAAIRGPFAAYVGGPLIDTFLKKAFAHKAIEYILVVTEKPLAN